jgi:hypothetical protein
MDCNKYFLSFFILTYSVLTLALTFFPDNVKGQDHRSNTEIVYDTIFVYDTIWTHETIYDTVWVYDTIFIDETINDITKMSAKDPGLIGLPSSGNVPLQLTPLQPMENSFFTVPSLKQPVKSIDKPSVKMKSDPYTSKLTLNPFRGEFDPSIFRNGEYSLEAYSGPVLQNVTYNFSIDDSRNQAIKESATAITGVEYGLRFSYHLAQLTIETGLGISQLRDKFNYTTTDQIVDSTEQATAVTRSLTFTDTIQFLDIDQLLKGDTVWTDYYYQYDSLVTYDSIYYERDTTLNSIPHQEIVTHYSLEIPILFSWQWEYAKMKIGVKAGGVNQIHLFSVGKAYSGYGEVGDIEDVVHFTRYNIALYGGLTCSYQLSKRISVGADAFYKYPLRKFEERFNASVYRQTYGANVSVCYHFKKSKK